jgi:hypothetical protein
LRAIATRRLAVAGIAAAAAATFSAVHLTEAALAAETPYEAESMEYGVVDSIDGTLWPKLITDSAASGGKALHYGPNGSAAKTVTVGAMSSITLRARGTQCEGAPSANVTLNGTSNGRASVSSTAWTTYTLPVSKPAGTYRLAVAFDNNHTVAGSCNRDLYLDRFGVVTTTTAPAPAPTAPTPTPTVVPAAQGNVVWAADGEAPLASEWATGNAFDVNGGNGTSTLSATWGPSTRVRRVTSPVAQGSYAFAMTVKAADHDAYTSGAQRTEVGQNNTARTMADGIDRQMRQGQDRWIAYQVRIPAGYPTATWNAIQQNKGEGKGNGPLSWYFEGGKLMLKKSASQSYGSTNANTVWTSPTPTARDKWIKILLHVKWSTGSDGFYEAFGDLADGNGFRQLKARTSGWTLKYGADGGPVNVGSRIGIYRSALSQDATAYFDGFNVAGSRADATARAFGASL